MIQKAAVGIGILGNEGRQAANNADFSIAQFSCLMPKILCPIEVTSFPLLPEVSSSPVLPEVSSTFLFKVTSFLLGPILLCAWQAGFLVPGHHIRILGNITKCFTVIIILEIITVATIISVIKMEKKMKSILLSSETH